MAARRRPLQRELTGGGAARVLEALGAAAGDRVALAPQRQEGPRVPAEAAPGAAVGLARGVVGGGGDEGAFLDREGNLVVAGSTYAGGNDEDWTFVLKYSPAGARLRAFVAKVGSNSVKLSDYGLQGVYATHGPDDSVYFAWDHTDQLDTKWTLARVVVPGADASPRGALAPQKVELVAAPRVVWTLSFEGEDAMSVEELVWFPGGAVGALGRGKRKLQGYDYRSDTRLRAVTAAGVDLGGARFGSPGDFHNEPTAVAVSPGGVAYVLGWQYWNGDGWNDENVMRLRFALRP